MEHLCLASFHLCSVQLTSNRNAARIATLRAEIETLEVEYRQISRLADVSYCSFGSLYSKGDPCCSAEDLVQTHIQNLHAYNLMRDNAQVVIGRLAAAEGVPVGEVWRKLGLEMDD